MEDKTLEEAIETFRIYLRTCSYRKTGKEVFASTSTVKRRVDRVRELLEKGEIAIAPAAHVFHSSPESR